MSLPFDQTLERLETSLGIPLASAALVRTEARAGLPTPDRRRWQLPVSPVRLSRSSTPSTRKSNGICVV